MSRSASSETVQRWIDCYVSGLPPLQITLDELERLPEYRATLPTGTTPGKRWKSEQGWQFAMKDKLIKTRWIVGEYDPTYNGSDPTIKVNWYRPVIRVKAISKKTD